MVGHNRRTLDRVFRYRKARRGHHEPVYAVDQNQVTITMPKAEVLSCQVDQTSLDKDSYYTNREGLGAEKINADDQTEAIKTAQENMLENVQSDESLLQQYRIAHRSCWSSM